MSSWKREFDWNLKEPIRQKDYRTGESDVQRPEETSSSWGCPWWTPC